LFPEFVTALIGVNDVVQGVPEHVYRANCEHILATLVTVVGPDRVVVVSTPDYTLTPRGAAFGNPATQSAQIRRFNEVLDGLADARSVRFVRIDGVSNRVKSEPELVARDGLHPSRAQYAAWVDLIAPVVIDALETFSAAAAD
jgi:lysophospholipase L1-like esterase